VADTEVAVTSAVVTLVAATSAAVTLVAVTLLGATSAEAGPMYALAGRMCTLEGTTLASLEAATSAAVGLAGIGVMARGIACGIL
jgi:hypothetical protein